MLREDRQCESAASEVFDMRKFHYVFENAECEFDVRVAVRRRHSLFIYLESTSVQASERKAFALKVGDRGTKNSSPGRGFIHEQEGARSGRRLWGA
jgi:hypothetical protein